MELQDRVAIVTGGSSGIGKAIATRLVQEGAKVAVLGHADDEGRRVEAELQDLAKRHAIAECMYLHADVSDSTQVRDAIAAVVGKWHQIHILVNNAAVMKMASLVDMEDEDWDLTMAVNLRGPFLLSKHAIPSMPAHGAILNISSVHSIATDACSTAYSTSKGGLETFTRALALECFPRRIRVNALRLGAVDTDMLRDNPQVKAGTEQVERSEVATPEEIAEIALFLVSARAAFISGSVVTADGGRLPILGSHTQIKPRDLPDGGNPP
ncbi:SDR family NAD(P)-dependent oxidoreductase [Massilia putida]|uniref:SDR family NAD(P)-dependent oxidoreductase n=1 Tax=Massilia putida TaxID=1141883 RepID=UPI0009530CA3|nr:SDR family oxidoreductase [Massilia putida]